MNGSPKLRSHFLTLFAAACLGWLLMPGAAAPASDALPAQAAPGAQYRFVAGEALACQLRLSATHQQQTDARWPDRQEHSLATNQAQVEARYELMPIAQGDDGAWKLRLVLHHLEQLTTRDGEQKRTRLDRADLPARGVDPYEVMKANMIDYLAQARLSGEPSNPPARAPAPPPTRFGEDLLAEPLLLQLTPAGALLSFQNRPELEQIAPGVNFKECLGLALPVLPREVLRAGTAWQTSVPVDLPAQPLDGADPAPMTMRLNFRVETIEPVDGRRCARIRVDGHFAQDNLAIPIHREIYKFLLWTKSVVRIEDRLEGEFLFDLDHQIMRRSSLRTVYQYTTLSGRKEDQSRSRIREDNRTEMRLTQTLAPSAPN